MKKNYLTLSLLLLFLTGISIQAKEKVIVAYVTSWGKSMPDPACMTHINYAFGHVNQSFDGVVIDNETKLMQITDLKTDAPDLKVLLSIGGWESGRFSEMAANENFRRHFAADCQRIVKQYRLDGIDIDWEYPTSNAANISASPDDTENFTLLMKDIRGAIGTDKLLTLASAANANYIDFKAILPYIDFVNIMSYDMGTAPLLHSALYRSPNAGHITADEAVEAHLAAGIPRHKLVMGLPFYGRGGKETSDFVNFNEVGKYNNYTEKWDETAQVPYLVNPDNELVLGYENVRSLTIKCEYIRNKGLLGGMYWDYDGDNASGDLRRTVHETLTRSTRTGI